MSKIKDKVVEKIPEKLKRTKTPPARITNDTIAEHREKILAGGRKFKYPLQYSKHKILINAIIVVILAVLAFGVWVWAMLYRSQATGDFFYTVTKFLPLPVANVDGQNVSYADYLRRARSSIYYKENQIKVDFSTDDGRRELDYLKRDELSQAERAAYALKIAKARNIMVSDEEVEAKLDNNLKTNTSEKVTRAWYESNVLRQYYDWTLDDYREELRSQLLGRKVAFAVDAVAKEKIAKVEARLKAGEDFAVVAREMSDDEMAKETGGGVVTETGDADPNSLVAAARGLEEGAVSGIIQGTDSYYIVRLDSKADDKTKYLMIKVILKQFSNDFAELKKAGKIKEYIKIPEISKI